MSSREVSRWNLSGAKAASTAPFRRQIEQLHSIASMGSASRLYAILPQWQLPRIGMTSSFVVLERHPHLDQHLQADQHPSAGSGARGSAGAAGRLLVVEINGRYRMHAGFGDARREFGY
jgi:hypothetical protein